MGTWGRLLLCVMIVLYGKKGFKLPMNDLKVVNGLDLMIFRRIKEKITCQI